MTHIIKHPLHPLRSLNKHQKSIIGVTILLILLNVIIFMLACQFVKMLLE